MEITKKTEATLKLNAEEVEILKEIAELARVRMNGSILDKSVTIPITKMLGQIFDI